LMHVLGGVFGKLKIAPSCAVPFSGGKIVLISRIEQSALGFEKTALRQPVLKFGGETTRQILLYDMRALFRGCGSPRERLMPGLGSLEIAVDAQEFAAHVRFQLPASKFVHLARGALLHRRAAYFSVVVDPPR